MSTEKKDMPHQDPAIEDKRREDDRDHATSAAKDQDSDYTFTDWASIRARAGE